MKGFSIIELVVVVGVIAVLASTITIYTRSFQRQNDLKASAIAVIQAIHIARAEAVAGDSDSAWGISIANGQAVVFKGKTYATRSPSSDQFYALPSGVSIAGTPEFDFSKVFATTTAGTTTLAVASPAATTTIYINSQGIIGY